MSCPMCGSPKWDPREELAARMAREEAFRAEYVRLNCPECNRRVSLRYDTIDAGMDTEVVRLHCHHCDHRFEVPRVKVRVDA